MAHIYRWFMKDISHFPMAISRILLGFCFLGAYLMRLPYFELLYGLHGFAGIDFYETAGTTQIFSPGLGKWLVFLNSESLVAACYALLLLSAFCFMVGFKARFFGLILVVLHFAFDQRNYLATAGWAKLAHCFVFYVALTRCGEAWSVDAFLKKRKIGAAAFDPLLAPAWPIRLLQIHVCTMYFVSSFGRLWQEMWVKGYAVPWTLLHLEYSRFNAGFLNWTMQLKAVSWMALAVEPFAFFALWLPVVGPVWVVALCLMHLTLELTTHVDWWNYMMIAGLITFIPDEWIEPLRRGRFLGEHQTQP